MSKRTIPIEWLREHFSYDPESGVLVQIKHYNIYRKRELGAPIGSVNKHHGYVEAHIDGVLHRVHRVIWAWQFGYWPEVEIDHKNLDRSDNRLCNLRLATKSQNMRNGRAQRNSKSGIRGVSYSVRYGTWVAQWEYEGKQVHRNFPTKRAAIEARNEAVKKYYGGFGVLTC